MITQNEGESRKEYLTRVTIWLLLNTAACEYVADYDETTCDGYCLADDLANEWGLCTEEIQAL